MSTQYMHPLRRRTLLGRTLLAGLAVGAAGRHAAAQAPVHEDPWPSLAAQIFNGRTVRDGSAVLAIDAPYRAEDAALALLQTLDDDQLRHCIDTARRQ